MLRTEVMLLQALLPLPILLQTVEKRIIIKPHQRRNRRKIVVRQATVEAANSNLSKEIRMLRGTCLRRARVRISEIKNGSSGRRNVKSSRDSRMRPINKMMRTLMTRRNSGRKMMPECARQSNVSQIECERKPAAQVSATWCHIFSRDTLFVERLIVDSAAPKA